MDRPDDAGVASDIDQSASAFVDDVKRRMRRRARVGRSSEDTVQTDRPLPYVRFSDEDLRTLIDMMRTWHDGSLLPMSLSGHHEGGWYSHSDLRKVKEKVPPRVMDWLLMTAIKGDVSVSLGLHFSSPSYYGRDVSIRGGKAAQHEAIYKKLNDFYRIRKRGRLPAALASFATLAIGAVALVFLIALVAGRAFHLLGFPESISSAPLSVALYLGPLAGLLSMVFVSAWITPHVLIDGWGRYHGRRQALRAFVLLVVASVVAVAVEWLIRGQ
jgi:hypothetical protein